MLFILWLHGRQRSPKKHQTSQKKSMEKFYIASTSSKPNSRTTFIDEQLNPWDKSTKFERSDWERRRWLIYNASVFVSFHFDMNLLWVVHVFVQQCLVSWGWVLQGHGVFTCYNLCWIQLLGWLQETISTLSCHLFEWVWTLCCRLHSWHFDVFDVWFLECA